MNFNRISLEAAKQFNFQKSIEKLIKTKLDREQGESSFFFLPDLV